jgi:pilus assembly protein CpaE
MESTQQFLLVSDNKGVTQWLESALRDEGAVVTSDSTNLERVLQLVDALGTRVVFVELSAANASRDAGFMEGLTSAKPLLAVVAMSEQPDRQTVLSALRAGARDFISPDMRPGEVLSLVRRAMSRDHSDQRAGQVREGHMTAVVSARPGADAPMFALHLALGLQEQAPDEEILLLDLGVPYADSLHYLGMESTYTFVDAIRSLRRLDDTLINSAFAKHESGLRVLAMPEESLEAGQFTTADLYVLLSALRRHFKHIVLNVGGVPASEFLYVMVGRSDKVLLLAEQSVPSCKQNRTLLQRLRDNKIGLSEVRLVVDRYLPGIPPNADTIAKGFGIPLMATLPSSGMARLTMMNSGESLFKAAPRDPYTQSVRKVAQVLHRELHGDSNGRIKGAAGTPGWLSSLTSRLKQS